MNAETCKAHRRVKFTYSLFEEYRDPLRLSQTLFFTKKYFIITVDGKRVIINDILSPLINYEIGTFLGFDEAHTKFTGNGTTYELNEFKPEKVISNCARCVGNLKRKCDLHAWTKDDLNPQAD